MATRKVLVELKVNLHIEAEEGIEISEIIEEMDYNFTTTGTDVEANADINDSSIEDYEVKDSR